MLIRKHLSVQPESKSAWQRLLVCFSVVSGGGSGDSGFSAFAQEKS